MKILDFIEQLKQVKSLSKHEQLVHGIIDTINSGHLQIGDQLPSINVMVNEVGYARKTIVKAYEELKDKGLVESKKTKGYFVISDNVALYVKIALLMYSFQKFQQEFYNVLRKELENKVQIDVFFHHNNEDMFETICSNVAGKYGMYVVAPIQTERCKSVLKKIGPEKLIVVDRFLDLGTNYTYVIQEFMQSTLLNLQTLLPKIKKREGIVLFYREDRDYPIELLNAFLEFVQKNNIKFKIAKSYESGSVQKDQLYLTIDDSDLWSLLKDCRSYDFRIGKDLGVLSFNDHIVKELVSGGISSISTDFKQMALTTAANIKELSFSKSIIPTSLIERDSV